MNAMRNRPKDEIVGSSSPTISTSIDAFGARTRPPPMRVVPREEQTKEKRT